MNNIKNCKDKGLIKEGKEYEDLMNSPMIFSEINLLILEVLKLL